MCIVGCVLFDLVHGMFDVLRWSVLYVRVPLFFVVVSGLEVFFGDFFQYQVV